jgi:hypothetical protein
MAAAIVATISLLVLGLPVAIALDRGIRGPLLIGTAFLYGAGLVFLVMLGLSVVHVPWSTLSVTIASLVIWIPLAARCSLLAGQPRAAVLHHAAHWLDLLSLVTLLGYAIFTTIAPLWEWDFWAIWGLKARVFFEHRGIDWRFLESPLNVFAHTDYPLLLPFNYDFLAIVNGAWSDRWLGILLAGFAIAIVLIVRGLAAEESRPFVAAMIAAAAATIAASRYVGLAEGPLIAFGGAAVLFIRRALITDDKAYWRHGAVLLGLAANVKNEGIALAVSVVIAIAIVRPRRLLRLLPAAAIVAPWLLLRATHVLPTDIVGGSVISRVMARVPVTWQIAQLLWADLNEPWVWLLLIAGIAVTPWARVRREAFILIATFVQLVFFIGSYYATPHDPRWHIVTSWPRLTSQLALPLTVAVLLMLAVSFAPDAEARSND